jgi:hypothetical protein
MAVLQPRIFSAAGFGPREQLSLGNTADRGYHEVGAFDRNLRPVCARTTQPSFQPCALMPTYSRKSEQATGPYSVRIYLASQSLPWLSGGERLKMSHSRPEPYLWALCFDGIPLLRPVHSHLSRTESWMVYLQLLVVCVPLDFKIRSDSLSALAVASVAIQVADSCMKLYEFWASIRDAPEEVAFIMEDLKYFSTVVAEIDRDKTYKAPSVEAGLRCCQHKIEVLSPFTFMLSYSNASKGTCYHSHGFRRWFWFTLSQDSTVDCSQSY